MATQRLVIDGDDNGHFFLVVCDGVLTVGADSTQGGVVLDQLRVLRIHCEVEVEEGPVVIGDDTTAAGAPPPGKEIHLGEELHVGPVHLRLVAATKTAAAARAAVAAAESEASQASAPACMGRRLVVIDGADLGRAFPLPETGQILIGNSNKHADIVLHDLYVSRVHCELEVEDDRVLVTHKEGRSATRINDKEIAAQELQLGDVLRVGNSHLRFEIGAIEPRAADDADDQETIAIAPTAAPGGTSRKTGGTAPADAGDPQAAADPLLQLEGQVLGNYHFGAVLGRGLSSLVFQARHRQTNQVAVVKVLARDFPQNDAELQTFIRALKTAAPLRHSNLVSIYAAGKTGQHCWIAREYVAGESLATLIGRLQAESKLGWKRACRVAIHLGQALDFLLRRRVVPSRLTPANVLIENDTRMTKLADVMLDQALHGSRLEEIIHEKRQAAEAPYCAPEQITPGAPTDHRAALYGLGAMLFALMTGQPPVSGGSSPEIAARPREGKAAKPSKIPRDTPPVFEAAVYKLLARRPEDRFQSAADMLAVVEPIANMHEIKV